MLISRRQFLVAGSVTATSLSVWYGLTRGEKTPELFKLDVAERDIIRTLTPVVLAGSLPSNEHNEAMVEKVASGVEQAIVGLSAAAQDDLKQLFMLLSFAPARKLLGLAPAWQEANSDEIAAFLEGLRFHPLELLQVAYHGLHDLLYGTWYGMPESWPTIGYSGPPTI